MGTHVFISYSHLDGEYVERLKQHLAEAGLSVWTDSGIDYGDQWLVVIAKQIEECAAFVPVMSPRSRESAWVRKEFLYAQERNKPILPLLLEGDRFFELIDVHGEAVTGGRMPSARFIDRLRRLAGSLADAGRAAAEGWSAAKPRAVEPKGRAAAKPAAAVPDNGATTVRPSSGITARPYSGITARPRSTPDDNAPRVRSEMEELDAQWRAAQRASEDAARDAADFAELNRRWPDLLSRLALVPSIPVNAKPVELREGHLIVETLPTSVVAVRRLVPKIMVWISKNVGLGVVGEITVREG